MQTTSTPTRLEVEAAVKRLVKLELGVSSLDQIKMESKFTEDLGADSFDRIELLMSAEDDFGIEISDPVAEKLITIQDLVDLICKEKP
jgi:acyl carrier protein